MEATFIRAEREDTGEDGWALCGYGDAYNATGPMGVAHDFFEHGCKLDTIQDEIMAHGAMYRLRWKTGYVYHDTYLTPKARDIGHEFSNLLQGMYHADLEAAPEEPELEDHVESDLRAIIAEGRHVGYRDAYCRDDLRRVRWIVKNYAGWFRKGYRWADEYYKCGAEEAVYSGFKSLIDELEKIEQTHELIHGDRLHVRFDPETAELEVTLERQCGECSAFCGIDDFLCDDCSEDA